MKADAAWYRWRRNVHDILEVGGDANPVGRAVNAFIVTLIILNAFVFAAETVDDVAARYATAFWVFNVFTVFVFTVEYVLRLWSAVEIPMLSRLPPWRARFKFAMRPMMLIDLFAFAPWYLHWIYPIDLRVLRVFRLFRLLKLVRYSPALQTLGRVLVDEYRALVGALVVMMVLILFASTGIYFLEREAQPAAFGSIPAAAWWAIATLTTVGYGDVVPITPFGKMLGGVVMLLGIGMFALPIAIIATGFAQESSRHQFVVTWSMVARMPLFATMDETEVAEITKLLYARSYLAGVPIVRAGDIGDGMYLLASGEATVEIDARERATLTQGDFFGEMALLEHRRHKHDVVAKTKCRVYVLDTRALARLTRGHPEIVNRIRKIAAERRDADEVTQKRTGARSKPAKQSEKI